MKSNEKSLLVLVVVLVICAAAYFGITAYKSAKEDAAEAEAEAAAIYLGSIDDPVSVSVTIEDVSYSYIKAEDVWTWDKDADFPLSSTTLDSLCALLTGLTATRGFEPTDSLEAYGLDGTVTLSVYDGDGDTLSLIIGASASDSTCYVMEAGGSLVYTIDGGVRTKAVKTPYDMIDLDDIPSVDRDYMSTITINSSRGEIEFTKDMESTDSSITYDWIVSVNGGEYRDISDTEQDVFDLFESSMSTGVSFITCYNYDVSDDMLAEYGLSPADIEITLQYIDADSGEERSYTLLYGYVASDNEYKYYAKLSDSLEVNSVYSGTYSYVSSILDTFLGE